MARRKTASSASDESPSRPATEGYTVLARRYRPRQFADLVGQEAVAKALVNALESNRVAHAYLFTGARGVGKTSTARILAKALNCVKGPTTIPCDACEICQSIAAGEDVDVLEIDAASNRGIDEVRELRQNIKSRPARTRFKIYIIDEVHMLTREAFNALLKTLEEPPAHVKFIFATTEVQKIPVTILSRCQRFDFAGIGTARIVETLRKVAVGEGMEADDEALELVARRAQGSMRDAQSLLDQLLAFGGQRLTSDKVHQLLGTAHDDRIVELVCAVLERDPKRSLEILAQTADEGIQIGELVDQLLDYWRDLMVVNCAGPEVHDLSIPPRHRETLARQAQALKLDTILAGLDVLATTKARLRGSHHGRVLLEMTLVRLGRLDDLIALSQLAQWLGPSAPMAAPNSPPSSTRGPAGRATAPPEALKKKPVNALAPTKEKSPSALTAETLRPVWEVVLGSVGRMLASDLEKAGLPAISAPNTLVLRFPVSYNSAREHCQQPANVARVEDMLKTTTGLGCHLRIETTGGDDSTFSKPQTAEPAENSHSRYRRQRLEAVKEPLVKRAMELMGAQLVHVDDGFGDALAVAQDRVDVSDGEET